MKKLLWLALAFFMFSFGALAQQTQIVCKPEQKTDPEADRQAILNLENGITHAIQMNNSSIINAVFSDDFSGITWYGEVINKAKQIRNIQTSASSYDFVRGSDFQVKIYRDIASVSSLRTERGSAQGRQFSRQFRVLRVYMNTPRGWRVIAQQETQLPTSIGR
jgi:hypothetical protein